MQVHNARRDGLALKVYPPRVRARHRQDAVGLAPRHKLAIADRHGFHDGEVFISGHNLAVVQNGISIGDDLRRQACLLRFPPGGTLPTPSLTKQPLTKRNTWISYFTHLSRKS